MIRASSDIGLWGRRRPFRGERFGLDPDAVKPGDVITVYMYQAKNGAPVGRTGKVVLANGKALGGGGGEVDGGCCARAGS